MLKMSKKYITGLVLVISTLLSACGDSSEKKDNFDYKKYVGSWEIKQTQTYSGGPIIIITKDGTLSVINETGEKEAVGTIRGDGTIALSKTDEETDISSVRLQAFTDDEIIIYSKYGNKTEVKSIVRTNIYFFEE